MEKHNLMVIRKNLESKLIEKAWKDEGFKNELVNNTKKVIEREIGKKIPEGLSITVLEETTNEVYLVLPKNPAGAGDELDESALDAVSGGVVPGQEACIIITIY